MKAYRRTLPAIAALVLLGTACSGTDTNTVTNEIPACSPSYPTGTCASGQSCFQGACVASASLCSPTNLTGTCAAGLTCFGGGCVLNSALPPVTPAVDCTKAVYTAQPTVQVGTGTGKSIITVDGKQFRDLNANGTLDAYEDWRLPEICRAQDLVVKMSAHMKIGLMSNASWIGGGTADGSIPASVSTPIVNDGVRQALIRFGTVTASQLAVYINNVQQLCETQPLGIPFLVNADPVHSVSFSTTATGANTVTTTAAVSGWPQTLGLGAANDLALTRQYGDTVRKEFMSMGFRWQLGPMADLATEPRWGRVPGTFGSNALAVSNHVQACINGFQKDGDLKNGIAATMKHFPGHGADEEGKDAHTQAGRYIVFPGNNLEYHFLPFQAAISAKVAAAMPCYGIYRDQYDIDPYQVGAAFSKGIVTDLLKKQLGFTGMVTSDWTTMSWTPWGVEGLTQPQRAALFIKAGSHQLGSDSYTIMQAAYDQQLVTDAEIDDTATKILELTFKLGLFENPYVDAAATSTLANSAENRQAGFDAQKKAMVILKNREHSTTATSGASYLPLSGSRTVASGNTISYIDDTTGDGIIRVYYDGVVDSIAGDPAKPDLMNDVLGAYDYTSAAATNTLAVAATNTLADADIAVLRIAARNGPRGDRGVPLSFDAPYLGNQLTPGFPPTNPTPDNGAGPAMADRNKVINAFRARDGYTDSTGTHIPPVNSKLKIVLVMSMSRPGIVKPFLYGLSTLDETAGVPGSYPLVSNPANLRADGLGGVDAFLVDFGAYDRAVLDVLFNKSIPASPTGYVYGLARLPLEIPSSDEEVAEQLEDVPNDTRSPTYPVGSGMSY